jgi:hypothetical protein
MKQLFCEKAFFVKAENYFQRISIGFWIFNLERKKR